MEPAKKSSRPRAAMFLLFLAVVAGVIYLLNVIIYSAVVLIFNITESSGLLLLGGSLGILSGSFIAASVIGNYHYNHFTRIYYMLSADWLGLTAYLFMAAFLYGFIVLFSGHSPNTLGFGLMLAALIVGIYGIWHARKIVVANISIGLPNLKTSWQGKKAVWISDLHLGQVYGSEFAEKITQKISGLSPDIIFIGGDLYDGTNADVAVQLIEPFKKLSAPLGIYFITGNHEEFGGSQEKFVNAIKSAGIRILQDEMIDIDGLQLIGVDYEDTSNKDRFKEILAGLAIDKNKASILLKHEPRHIEVAEKAGISLQISGHTHKAQQWPFVYLANLIYGRFTYGLNKIGKMQIYTSSGIGTWGPPMRVGTDSEIVVLNFID